MIWRVFRKSPQEPSLVDRWWAEADAAADTPTQDAVTRLRESAAGLDPDDADRREEMLDALTALAAIAAASELPRVDTRHRVIGDDACHWVAPVTVADSTVAAKLFVTSRRLVVMAGGVTAWPWHRVRDMARADRDVIVTITGATATLHVRFNSYTDALVARHLGRMLAERKP